MVSISVVNARIELELSERKEILLIVEEEDDSVSITPKFKGCIRRILSPFASSIRKDEDEDAYMEKLVKEEAERFERSDHSVYVDCFYLVYTGDVIFFKDSTE